MTTLSHGHAYGGIKSPTYSSWSAMRARCLNCRNPNYTKYGARGITICEKWNSFSNFLSDMGERPHGTSLDRIDNKGNYEPSNCRWATKSEQQNNTSVSIKLPGGFTIKQASDILGINPRTLRWRVKNGKFDAIRLNKLIAELTPQL